MEIINYAFQTILAGVSGNAAYEGIKLILGGSFSNLEASVKANDKDKFEMILQTAIVQNNEIKQQLEQLRQSKSINVVKQDNVFGDNIVGNKNINK